MKFGVGFFTAQRPAGDPRPFAELYADVLDHARTAESAGLDSFWVAEHHFSTDGYVSSVLPLCGAIAAVTSRITIGCEVATSLHSPLRLAEDSIFLDHLSRGRFVLGLARTYRKPEFDAFGIDPEAESSRLEETIALLRSAYAGQPVATTDGTELKVMAPLTAGGPKLLMGFHGDPGTEAERAARVGDLFRTDPSATLDQVKEVVAIFDAHRPDSASGDLFVFCYGYVSKQDPWAAMADGFRHLRTTYDQWGGNAGSSELRREDYRLLIGSPDEVAADVGRYRELFGDRVHIVLRLDYPGMERLAVTEAIRLFGGVATRVREHAAT